MHHRASQYHLRADSPVMALLASVGAALVALLYGTGVVDAAAAGIIRGYR